MYMVDSNELTQSSTRGYKKDFLKLSVDIYLIGIVMS